MNISIIPAKEAKNSFGAFINTVQREPVVVTKKNKPVGVFLSINDLEKSKEIYLDIEKYFKKEKESNPFIDMLGKNKKNRLFNNINDVDKFITNLRKEWI